MKFSITVCTILTTLLVAPVTAKKFTPGTGLDNNNEGGLHNAASDPIQRKLDNDDSGENAFIGGGVDNAATGEYCSILGGRVNVASGSASTVGGGFENTASGDGSIISGGGNNVASGFSSMVGGGFANTASGDRSFVGGGDSNTANGDYSIAMGRFANAEADQSCVINLLPDEKVASSTKVGEFLVSSKSFTIQIGSKKVTISKNNIKNFKKLLKGKGRRLEQIDGQKEIIKELQQQNNKQQEQIDELHRMLINFVGRSTE